MAPSAWWKESWGDPAALPMDKLRPTEEINRMLQFKGSPFEWEEKVINGRMVKCWKNLPANYRDMWIASAAAFAEKEYLVYGDDTLTYKQAFEQSLLVAHWLASQFQVRRGDRVGIAMRNYTEFMVSFWACQLIGAVATALNAFSETSTLAFCINDVGCRVVICDLERLERIQPVVEQLRVNEAKANKEADTLRGLVVLPYAKGKGKGKLPKSQRSFLSSEPDGFVHGWEELGEKWRATCPAKPPALKLLPEDYAHIFFTSGTTGKPKGVVSTHRQSIHGVGAAWWIGARVFLRRYRSIPDSTKNPDPSIAVVAYPLFHVAGMLSHAVLGAAQGSKLLLMHSWNVDDAVELINKHKANKFAGVAHQCRQIALHPAEMPSMGSITHGGSAASRELAAESDKKLGNQGGSIGSGYGATETNSLATGNYQDDYMNFPDSVGAWPPTTDIKIVDPNTLTEVPKGDKGEIWIRSSGVATGYWNRPQANAETFLPDGFYRTGDMGYIHKEHGLLFISDRIKDIIIRGGENITTVVVENGVYSHPKVLEVAAVALPDKAFGERVAAFVVPRDGIKAEDLSEEEIKAAARKVLPKHEVPEFIVLRDEPLPKIPAGKIDKKILRDELLKIAVQRGWGDFGDRAKAKL